jgi:hypothetical protein
MGKKFMNAGLIAIRDSLKCGSCGKIFKGTDSQAWKVRYERGVVYCSYACRLVATRKRQCTPVPYVGPCPTCGKAMYSRKSKKHCSVACYQRDPKSLERLRIVGKAGSATLRAKAALRDAKPKQPCSHCGEPFTDTTGRRKYCSSHCYHAYRKEHSSALTGVRLGRKRSGQANPARKDPIPPPERVCKYCGKVFTQSTRFGHAIYCGKACCKEYYRLKYAVVNPKQRLHNPDGTFHWVDTGESK